MLDKIINIDQYKLAVDSIIAEGGFSYVYKVRDTGSNSIFALKKINSSDKETQSEIENEIQVLQSLQKHPHIMEFITYVKLDLQLQPVKPDQDYKFRNTYLILSEYCDRGTLNDLELPIQELEKACRIIYQTVSALKHIHNVGIIHRDIKAENILFDKNGRVKLCDFGSSTRNSHEPSVYWTLLERSTVEEEMQRHTTPLYRAPEILETYLHYPINHSIDIWALGCLIYYMRFGQHAFPDSGKLSIVNCRYTIPRDVSDNDPLVTIIRQCLVADPRDRVSIEALMNSMVLDFHDMDLNGSIVPFSPSSRPQTNPEDSFPKMDLANNRCEISDENKNYDNQCPEENQEIVVEKSMRKTSESSYPSSADNNVDTLIDIAPSDIKPFQMSNPQTAPNLAKSTKNCDDPIERAGLPRDLMQPEQKFTDVDNLFDMDGKNPSESNSDHEILSPKKAVYNAKIGIDTKKDAFDDLLESFGTTLPSNGAFVQSHNHIHIGSVPSYDEFGSFDPKLRIHEWKESRRGNIRSLLSSLHLVLSEEFRWKPVGMHQLVADSDVKKIYRLACLAIHPDKLCNCDEDTKEMAKMIFVELNEAWSKFEGK